MYFFNFSLMNFYVDLRLLLIINWPLDSEMGCLSINPFPTGKGLFNSVNTYSNQIFQINMEKIWWTIYKMLLQLPGKFCSTGLTNSKFSNIALSILLKWHPTALITSSTVMCGRHTFKFKVSERTLAVELLWIPSWKNFLYIMEVIMLINEV